MLSGFRPAARAVLKNPNRRGRAGSGAAGADDAGSTSTGVEITSRGTGAPSGTVALPAPPARFMGEPDPSFGPIPGLGEHTEEVRQEFLG